MSKEQWLASAEKVCVKSMRVIVAEITGDFKICVVMHSFSVI